MTVGADALIGPAVYRPFRAFARARSCDAHLPARAAGLGALWVGVGPYDAQPTFTLVGQNKAVPAKRAVFL